MLSILALSWSLIPSEESEALFKTFRNHVNRLFL